MINSDTNSVTAVGTGATNAFSFSPLRIQNADDLQAVHVATDGTKTTLTRGVGASNYSVTVSLYPGTGYVTYPADESSFPAETESLIFTYAPAFTQVTQLAQQGGYNPETVEQALDRSLMRDLNLKETLDRALLLPVGTELSLPLLLPDPVASTLIGWNAGGTALTSFVPNSETYLTLPLTLEEGGTGVQNLSALQTLVGADVNLSGNNTWTGTNLFNANVTTNAALVAAGNTTVSNLTLTQGNVTGNLTLGGVNTVNGVTKFNAAGRGALTELTDGATIAVDMAATNHFFVTLGGNRTLGQPTNQVAGQSGHFIIIQDGTGSRTLSVHTDYETVGGAGLTLSSDADAKDLVPYFVQEDGSILLGEPLLGIS